MHTLKLDLCFRLLYIASRQFLLPFEMTMKGESWVPMFHTLSCHSQPPPKNQHLCMSPEIVGLITLLLIQLSY